MNLEAFKWSSIFFVSLAAVAVNFYFINQPPVVRLTTWVLWAAIVGILGWRTHQGQRFVNFSRETRIELKRVTWPTRQEAIQTTIVVAVMVVIMSLLIWLMDAVLMWGVGFITGQRG